MTQPAWWVLSELGAALGRGDEIGSAADAFAALAREVAPFEGLSYAQLGYVGELVAKAVPA